MVRLSSSAVLFLVLALAVMSAGCQKRPKGVLSDSQMQKLMVDLALADAYEHSASSSHLPDSIKNQIGEAVLKKHGVDRATLDSTFSWYAVNLDDYMRLYAGVEKELTNRLKKAGASESSTLQNNIWALPAHIQLVRNSAQKSLTFQLPGGMIEGGEELVWKMKTRGTSNLALLLGIDYSNGMSSFVRRDFPGNRIELSVIADTIFKPTRIYGYITSDSQNLPIWLDSISLVKNPFDSLKYVKINSQKRIFPPALLKKEKVSPDSLFSAEARSDTSINRGSSTTVAKRKFDNR